jgi:hypothetical protein
MFHRPPQQMGIPLPVPISRLVRLTGDVFGGIDILALLPAARSSAARRAMSAWYSSGLSKAATTTCLRCRRSGS